MVRTSWLQVSKVSTRDGRTDAYMYRSPNVARQLSMRLALQPNKSIQRGIDDQTSGSTSHHKIAFIVGAFAAGVGVGVGAAILTVRMFVNRNDPGTPALLGRSPASEIAVDSDPDSA